MGHSLIIKGADFSANGIKRGGIVVYRSAKNAVVMSVAQGQEQYYGGYRDLIAYDADESLSFLRYVYCVDVRGAVGMDINITFCVGYGSNILSYGGFVETLPSGIVIGDGWAPPKRYTPMNFLTVVGTITSEESNVWVTKTYTIPVGAKYLFFTSKLLSGGDVVVELANAQEEQS